MNSCITYYISSFVVYLALSTPCTTPAAEEVPVYPVFPASDIKAIFAKEGQKITVKGLVSDVRKSKGGTHFIHFQDSDFYLITFKSDLSAFEKGGPVEMYQGKHLSVTGVVSLYQKKPQIILSHPDMVRLVAEDAPVPSPEKKRAEKDRKHQQNTEKASIKNPEKKAGIKTKAPPVDAKKYFK